MKDGKYKAFSLLVVEFGKGFVCFIGFAFPFVGTTIGD
jgi:hypothetical protein